MAQSDNYYEIIGILANQNAINPDYYSLLIRSADGVEIEREIKRINLLNFYNALCEEFGGRKPYPQTYPDPDTISPFKIGDCVRLKSETRWMTVLTDCCGAPECGWFEGGRHHCEAFPTAALTKDPPQDDIPL